jgi:hypothetical protein
MEFRKQCAKIGPLEPANQLHLSDLLSPSGKEALQPMPRSPQLHQHSNIVPSCLRTKTGDTYHPSNAVFLELSTYSNQPGRCCNAAGRPDEDRPSSSLQSPGTQAIHLVLCRPPYRPNDWGTWPFKRNNLWRGLFKYKDLCYRFVVRRSDRTLPEKHGKPVQKTSPKLLPNFLHTYPTYPYAPGKCQAFGTALGGKRNI